MEYDVVRVDRTVFEERGGELRAISRANQEGLVFLETDHPDYVLGFVFAAFVPSDDPAARRVTFQPFDLAAAVDQAATDLTPEDLIHILETCDAVINEDAPEGVRYRVRFPSDLYAQIAAQLSLSAN